MRRFAGAGVVAALVTGILAGVSTGSQAAGPDAGRPGPRTAITFEPLGAIYARAFAIEVEQRVAPRWTVLLQPALILASQAATGADGVVSGETSLVGSATLGCRYFLVGQGLDGLFLGPLLTASFGGFARSSDATTPVALAAGALGGYTFLLGQTFLLSTGVGAQYHARVDAGRPAGGDRVLPLLRLAIGAAF